MELPYLQFVIILLLSVLDHGKTDSGEKLLVLAVAKKETSGLRKFLDSAHVNGLSVKVLGLGGSWDGDGHKVIKLKEELERYKTDDKQVILFANGPDALVNAGPKQILNKFHKFSAKIVFSSEKNCWPDFYLTGRYPPGDGEQKYLNSGIFIGYAPELYRLVTFAPVSDYDDDQRFYTSVFLNETQRESLKFQLDYRSEMFQNLYSSTDNLVFGFEGEEPYIQNAVYGTRPVVYHANGKTQAYLSTLSNYVSRTWNPVVGCKRCSENNINLGHLQWQDYPSVLLGVFIEQATPSLMKFFIKIHDLDYPREKIHLFIHNAIPYHSELVDRFVEEHSDEYASVKVIGAGVKLKEWRHRDAAIDECLKKKCDYYFNVDAVAQLDNSQTLRSLIEQNRSVVAPMLNQLVKEDWSNFWASITNDGQYAESMDYGYLVRKVRRGLWNVPYVSKCYLVKGEIIHNPKTRPFHIQVPHLAFCSGLRDKNVDMFLTNRLDWGHLIDPEGYQPSTPNELFFFKNPTNLKNSDISIEVPVAAKTLGSYWTVLVLLSVLIFFLARWSRKQWMCKPRIIRILFFRNVSKIWSAPQ